MLHVLLALILLCPVADGLPPRADVWRFPFTDAQVESAAKFSAAHAEWACGPRQPLLAVWGPAFLGRAGGNVRDQRWRTEALYCEDCWALLQAARRWAHAPLTGGDDNLVTLRRLLGREAYWRGLMPPMAPYWYFRDLDR